MFTSEKKEDSLFTLFDLRRTSDKPDKNDIYFEIEWN